MDSDSSHKAVCIVEIVEDANEQAKCQIKLDEFEKIFDAVRNVPVAIISIAGACRSGKSFMMTLLADYLLKNPSGTWGKRKQSTLTQVFEHRGGVHGHTNGIYVTRKPFMLKTKDEKEVAVFLMDTQGMFDKKSSANDNSMIFALSTLLSSVQIYNISGLIQEDNLQNLKLFTDYAHCVSNKKGNVSTLFKGIQVNHPFQGLLFLCRNWEQSDYAIGFEGGSVYLNDVMVVNKKENKSVRKRLKESFSYVCCSLMPHPGRSVSGRGFKDSKAVCFSDMGEDFISEVDALAKHLFGKEHLVAKKLNGRELTGEGLIDLASEYKAILHCGEIPEIKVLVKSNEKVEFLLKIKDIEYNYKRSMQAQIGEMPLVPEKLEALHLQNLSEAKDLFYMHNILKDESERQKYLKEMERNIGILCQVVSKDNEAKIALIMGEIDKHIRDAGKVYYKSLEEFASDFWVEDIRKAKETATEKANACFQARVNDLKRHWLDNKKRMALQSTFDLKQKQFEKKNAERKGMLDTHMSHLFMEAIQIYGNRMESAVKQINQDIEPAHERSKSFALAFFNDSNIGKDTKYKEGKELELKLELSKELKQYQEIYEKNMDDELAKVVTRAKEIYLQNIQAMDQYVVETELETSHFAAERMAMKVAKNEKFKNKVTELIHFEKERWILRNELLKSEEEKRITRQREILEDDYKSEYEDIEETYVDDAKLRNKHAKALKKAITDLSYYKTKHTEALKKNREELEKNINATFQMVGQTNAEKRKSVCDKLHPFEAQLEADYFEKIYEVTRKRHVENKKLNKLHSNFKAAVKREVEPLIPFADIFKETLKRSFKKLNANFEKVKAGNTSWNAFSETVGEFVNEGAGIGGTILGIPGGIVVGAAAGVTGVVGGLINLGRSVDGDIDVSELKSILYLKELELDANKIS